MVQEFTRNWWIVALRGLLAVLFGLAAFAYPLMTATLLATFLGVYILVDGISATFSAVTTRNENSRWWLQLVGGLVGIAAGAAALFWPGLTELSILFLIGGWAIVNGIISIFEAIRYRQEMEGEWLYALFGALSLLFGIYLLAAPLAGLLTILGIIATFALFVGMLQILVGLRMRSLNQVAEQGLIRSFFSRQRWSLLLRGVVAIAFGLALIIWPQISLTVVLVAFGLFTIVDGLVALFMGLSGQTGARWFFLVGGLIGMAVGVVALLRPDLTATVLLSLIAAWALISGLVQIVTAVRMRDEIEGEWSMALNGLLALALGVALFVWPGAGLLSLLWLIGGFAILSGVLQIILSSRVGTLTERIDDRRAMHAV